MATSDYNPVSWNGEPITTAKLNQMCNNTQWIFDRMPKIRYASNNINRENTIKVLAGWTPFPPDTTHDYVNVDISFGSYFTAGCHPVITATVEVSGGAWRKYVSIQGLGGQQTDNTGFRAQVVSHETSVQNINQGGWIHWTAVGY
jgi:hypothetical protein